MCIKIGSDVIMKCLNIIKEVNNMGEFFNKILLIAIDVGFFKI